MKFILLFPLIIPVLLLGQSENTLKPQNILEIADALRQKLVQIELLSVGGYAGETVQYKCKSLSNKNLRILIPQGQLLVPGDSSLQTLVVAQEQLLSLGKQTPFTGKLRTFCTEAGDLSPASGDAFKVAAMAPAALCKLLKALTDKGKLDNSSAQSAVWAVSSRRNLAGIEDEEIKLAAAEIMGKTAPPYHIKYQVETMPHAPADLGKAVLVEHRFQYTLDKDDKLSLILFDSNNKQIKVLRKDEPARAGEHRSSLKVEVWNLDPGSYFVRLKKKNGEVLQEIAFTF